MDDITICTEGAAGARWILRAMERLVSWARMQFKPRKSRSLVIKKGKVDNRCSFSVQAQQIPTITEAPIKCLGKWYRGDLKNRGNIAMVEKDASDMLKRIEDTGFQ